MKLKIENTSDEIREVAIRASLGDSWYMEKPDSDPVMVSVIVMIGVCTVIYAAGSFLFTVSLVTS